MTALLLAASRAGASQALGRDSDPPRLRSRCRPGRPPGRGCHHQAGRVAQFHPLVRPLAADLDFFGRLRLLLRQADVKWTVGGLLFASLGCWVLAAACSTCAPAAVLPAVAAGRRGCLHPLAGTCSISARRRFDTFEEMLPEALDLIVSALRAGHGLNSAIGTVAKEMSGPDRHGIPAVLR